MNEVEKDLIIDETSLSKESLNTAKIYGKYLRIRANENIRLNALRSDLKKLYVIKREYYSGRAAPEVYRDNPFNQKLLKTDVDTYVEADPEIDIQVKKIDVQSEKINYLNDALKMIAGRQFQIKNAIDYQKLINGVV